MKQLSQNIFWLAGGFARDNKGAAAIEYALIAAATGLALAASLPSVQSGLSTLYTSILGTF